MSGPFSWDEADISITVEPPNQYGEICDRVIDKKAGFDLLCSSVTLVRGDIGMPTSPFENFLDDR